MYQPDHVQTQPRSSDDRILQDAVAIVSATGLATLSVRALAERNGVNPSLISYRFGSKRGLVSALSEYVDGDLKEVWSRRLNDLPAEPLDSTALVGLTMGILVDNAVAYRDLMRAAWALRIDALRDAPQATCSSAVSAHGTAFWERVLALSGLTTDLAEGLAGTLESLGHTLLIHQPKSDLTAWCSDVVSLQFALLTEEPAFRSAESVWRARYAPNGDGQTVETQEAPTRAKIIETAKSIIQTDGYRELTHREIAKRSGVSLSSTTHHFSSLDEIMISAYWSIYADATSAAQAIQTSEHPKSMEEYIDRVLPALNVMAQSGGLGHIVFEEILLLSAQKPELRQI